MKIILTILVVACIGAFVERVAENYFGVENVMIFCFVVVAVVGIVVVPFLQLKAIRIKK